MKNIFLFLFLTFFLASVVAEEINHDDPAVRKIIINHAHSLFSKGEYVEAAKHYRFGMTHWNKPEQAQDLKTACGSLFVLLYVWDKHARNRELFDGCLPELVEVWYGTEGRDYYPLMKVAPIYPGEALDGGIEGWVIVEFDINKHGRVKNAEAVESSDLIFNKSAIKAAKSFLYLPRIENGVPVEARGVENKITFKLDGQ